MIKIFCHAGSLEKMRFPRDNAGVALDEKALRSLVTLL